METQRHSRLDSYGLLWPDSKLHDADQLEHVSGQKMTFQVFFVCVCYSLSPLLRRQVDDDDDIPPHEYIPA